MLIHIGLSKVYLNKMAALSVINLGKSYAPQLGKDRTYNWVMVSSPTTTSAKKDTASSKNKMDGWASGLPHNNN